jgi:predicted transcriptional regulator
MDGLKGAQRIVFDELVRTIENHEQPSISFLAQRTLYTEQTVRCALVKLHDMGIIRYQSYGRGKRAIYEVLEE